MNLTYEEQANLIEILVDLNVESTPEKQIEITALIKKIKKMPVVHLEIRQLPNFEEMTITERVRACSEYSEYLRSILEDAINTGKSYDVENLYAQLQNQVNQNMIDINEEIEQSKLDEIK